MQISDFTDNGVLEIEFITFKQAVAKMVLTTNESKKGEYSFGVARKSAFV